MVTMKTVLSRFEDAAKACQQELDLSPNNAVALSNLGQIEVQNRDAEAGVALLNRKEDSNRALAELTRLKAQASKSDASHE